ncbi:hypothetical protein H696_04217 [Fonticula alba]|uniref:Palmitoyltransferase n=1 Tax=Fonticula alba TaxID=691883 RepID=A0A058Z4E4_FONAL|nr:hypothetical protein H696_04217 [Fonticula alba]KCV68798.1 hypothetical protein H696_04217 [Fonticula alba]|eukprot:XP_009496369.1 hypothetical protein H696_04217 [Fonticula alba]
MLHQAASAKHPAGDRNDADPGDADASVSLLASTSSAGHAPPAAGAGATTTATPSGAVSPGALMNTGPLWRRILILMLIRLLPPLLLFFLLGFGYYTVMVTIVGAKWFTGVHSLPPMGIAAYLLYFHTLVGMILWSLECINGNMRSMVACVRLLLAPPADPAAAAALNHRVFSVAQYCGQVPQSMRVSPEELPATGYSPPAGPPAPRELGSPGTLSAGPVDSRFGAAGASTGEPLPPSQPTEESLLQTLSDRHDAIVTLRMRDRCNNIRYCQECMQVKPDRTHHCSICNICVLRMDHHCSFLGVCIGLGNHKAFVLLLLYSSIFVWTCGLTSFASIVRAEFRMSEIHLFWIVASALSLCFGFVTGGFCGFHMYLIARNRTTFDFSYFYHIYKELYDQYNMGPRGNFAQIFGTNIWLWPLPTPSHSTDGVNFPIRSMYHPGRRSGSSWSNAPDTVNSSIYVSDSGMV